MNENGEGVKQSDEEAAKLIQLQQAYQAAGQVISIANELFDVIINATRR